MPPLLLGLKSHILKIYCKINLIVNKQKQTTTKKNNNFICNNMSFTSCLFKKKNLAWWTKFWSRDGIKFAGKVKEAGSLGMGGGGLENQNSFWRIDTMTMLCKIKISTHGLRGLLMDQGFWTGQVAAHLRHRRAKVFLVGGPGKNITTWATR